jgi:isohexenylglutaconyl-CoA hydratase
MLTGARFAGAEALALGLADFLVDDAAGLADAELLLRTQVRRCAPGANAATKRILLATQTLHGDALRRFAAEQFAGCVVGPEGQEGLRAFVEKRKPAWAVAAGEARA